MDLGTKTMEIKTKNAENVALQLLGDYGKEVTRLN